MSREEVRKAFHVPDKVQRYIEENKSVVQDYKTLWEGSVWIYEIFQKLGYKTLHMMGSSDGIQSLHGAWQWIKRLNYKTTKSWTPWLSKEGDLIGFVKEWGNFTLVTIHGLGHIGQFERFDESPDLILRYLHDEPII